MSNKQDLCREYNFMIMKSERARTISQPLRLNRRLPERLQKDISNYEMALSCLKNSLRDKSTRRAYYLLNGVK